MTVVRMSPLAYPLPHCARRAVGGAVVEVGLAVLLLSCDPLAKSTAQISPPPIDSLVASFIEQGPLSQWRPGQLYAACPALDSRQQRGIELLRSAKLSADRLDELAGAWAVALRECDDPTLEQWYFDTMSGLTREGQWPSLFRFRDVLGRTATPAVQGYMRTMMLDATMPEVARMWAGIYLIQQLGTTQVRAEWRSTIESEQVPWQVVRYATMRLLSEDKDWLVPELAERIRANPDILQSIRLQTVFLELNRTGSQQQREVVATAIEESAASVQEDRRASLLSLAEWVRGGRK